MLVELHLRLEDTEPLPSVFVTHYEDDDIFQDSGEYFYGIPGRTIKRLIYIGEYLYSISPDYVRSYDLDDVTPINFIKLAGAQSDDVWYLEEPMLEF